MQTTRNTTAFIEADVHSQFILTHLQDGLLPSSFYRDVSDFGHGEVLNIKTIGTAQLQEVEEDTPLVYSPIETGVVQMRITDYTGDAWYITDKLRQDGSQIEVLLAQRAAETTRAIQENFETRAFETINAAQTPNNANSVNGFAHRFLATGTNETITTADLIKMKVAFDKADVPYGGRIAVVDPIVSASLTMAFQGVYNVDSNPTMQRILEGSFTRDHSFVMELFGWNIMTSNRLPRVAVGSEFSNTKAGVANIFLSVESDQSKSLMAAWRQQPRTEFERNKDKQRDEFVTTCRFGLGVQRLDTIGVIITSATDVE